MINKIKLTDWEKKGVGNDVITNKLNEIIEHMNTIEMVKVLNLQKEGLKPKSCEPFVIQMGNVALTAEIDYKSGRISIYSTRGQTSMDFIDRKVEAVENIAKCMLQAVEIYKKGVNNN